MPQNFKQISRERFSDYEEARRIAEEKFLKLSGMKSIPKEGMQTETHKARVRRSVSGGIESFYTIMYEAIKKEDSKPAQKVQAKKAS